LKEIVMRFLISAALLLVATAAYADPGRVQQLMISTRVCEIPDKADARPQILAEPKIVTVANRPVHFHVGRELKLPKLDDIKPTEVNTGTRMQLTCGEPREGKVSIDLKISLATPQKREDDLAAVSEQSLHVQGSIPLGLEKRFALTNKDDGVQRYVLLKIEQVLAEGPPSVLRGEVIPVPDGEEPPTLGSRVNRKLGEAKPLIIPRIIIQDEDEEKLRLDIKD